jgi:hypothetical protein
MAKSKIIGALSAAELGRKQNSEALNCPHKVAQNYI